MQDPEWVFATFLGRVDIIPTGRAYRQTYGGLFHVVNGEIRPKDTSGSARNVVGGQIDFVLDVALLVWEEIPE